MDLTRGVIPIARPLFPWPGGKASVPGRAGEGIIVVAASEGFGHARPDFRRKAGEENGLFVVGRKALEKREQHFEGLAFGEDRFGEPNAAVAVDVEAHGAVGAADRVAVFLCGHGG